MSRLLVIDDDQGFCEMIADYLKPEGFEVTSIARWEGRLGASPGSRRAGMI